MNTTSTKLLMLIIFIVLAISCDKSDNNDVPNIATGKGGSMARFTIYKNYLYTVDQEKLTVFSLNQPESPSYQMNISTYSIIETIFANNNTLFLGSQGGMFAYDITDPKNPVKLSYFQHIYSCDPVVANDTMAYLTLRTESFCGRNTNELQVLDITNPSFPVFISRVLLKKPYGLGLDGKNLFVCDDGLKVFSLDNPQYPVLRKTFNIPAIDVIPDNNILLVLATDGLYQYKFQNDTITYLSHLQ